jgi:hypothetical protein
MRLWLLVVGSMCLALAGCETLREATSGARERLTTREAPRTWVYSATQRETYEAVRTAASRMGYRFLRGGAAQGEFDAVSGLSANDSLRGSRQISMKVRLGAALDGGTEVSVWLTEIIEPESASRTGLPTEAPLRDTPQYEVFLRSIGEALSAVGASKPEAKLAPGQP